MSPTTRPRLLAPLKSTKLSTDGAAASPVAVAREVEFDPNAPHDHLTHRLIRYPAKFHPPVARWLLETFTATGDRVLDPFCGSGTLLIEGRVLSRDVVGSDVDPLAVFVSRAKVRAIDPDKLRVLSARLDSALEAHERSASDYETLQWSDLADDAYTKARDGLVVPAIPNLLHWFRKYVVIDLAHLRHVIRSTEMTEPQRAFFLLCFAAIIRGSSNADPVPVSGLEVTSHMKKRDEAGRVVNPFALFRRAVSKSITAMEAYRAAIDSSTRFSVVEADATRVAGKVRGAVDAVITSPPYHGAVDYYRRHQLEMFWLDLTRTQQARLELLAHYIGRPKVPARDPLLKSPIDLPEEWRTLEAAMRAIDPVRANAFVHYCTAMHLTLQQLGKLLPAKAPVALVVGRSQWNGDAINTSDLFAGLAVPEFEIDEEFSYPIRNRYMSYSRHNGADINREYVLVLRRST